MMTKASLLQYLLLSLIWLTSSCNQPTSTDEKLSVEERMANARAAKAEKRVSKLVGELDRDSVRINSKPDKTVKATAADYQTPVDKVLKGPNGEAVHVGERGAKYYINKNGNKTYLSSNR